MVFVKYFTFALTAYFRTDLCCRVLVQVMTYITWLHLLDTELCILGVCESLSFLLPRF